MRQPDQIYQYMYEVAADVVYKRERNRWTVFGRKTNQGRRFRQTSFSVDSIPATGVPIQVIEGSRYLLPVDMDRYVTNNNSFRQNNETVETGVSAPSITGYYEINENQLEELKAQWNEPESLIIGATDGGLKDQKGTCSYAIFLPGDDQAAVEGYDGEFQPRCLASSTRQELLGQLPFERWLNHFQEWWGEPRSMKKVVLITDSQSSMDIMLNVQKITGLKDTLRAEMDVAMELGRQRALNWWVQRDIIKVESHIEQAQAPNEFYWSCNDIADKLATKAREWFSLEELQNKPAIVLQGTRAICMLDGIPVNSDLYNALHEKMMGGALRRFLIEKNGWTTSIFNSISWEAYQAELLKTPLIQRPTLIKYIHGWLATKIRRGREGAFRDSLCPLCGNEDSKNHFLVVLQCTIDHHKRGTMEVSDRRGGKTYQKWMPSSVSGGPEYDKGNEATVSSDKRRVATGVERSVPNARTHRLGSGISRPDC